MKSSAKIIILYLPFAPADVPKNLVCDDTAIELDVEPRAQWLLQRHDGSAAIEAPLTAENWLLRDRLCADICSASGSVLATPLPTIGDETAASAPPNNGSRRNSTSSTAGDRPPTTAVQNDQWLSQVEIITHAGPHRRLWMGPQFMFKTYNAPSR